MISPALVLQNQAASCCLCCGYVGNALALSKRSGRRCGASPPDRPPRRRAWGGRSPSAPRPQARIGGAPTGPCQTVRPSLFDRARSSTGPPGQEIPFDRQLADLGVKLGRLAFALFLAIARTARPSREQARDVVENLLTASRTSVLRLAANDLRTQQGRPWGQPQAGAAADAGDGDRGAGSAPRHEQSRARAQDIPLPFFQA